MTVPAVVVEVQFPLGVGVEVGVEVGIGVGVEDGAVQTQVTLLPGGTSAVVVPVKKVVCADAVDTSASTIIDERITKRLIALFMGMLAPHQIAASSSARCSHSHSDMVRHHPRLI